MGFSRLSAHPPTPSHPIFGNHIPRSTHLPPQKKRHKLGCFPINSLEGQVRRAIGCSKFAPCQTPTLAPNSSAWPNQAAPPKTHPKDTPLLMQHSTVHRASRRKIGEKIGVLMSSRAALRHLPKGRPSGADIDETWCVFGKGVQ